jgi:hypothetical protein
MAIRRRLFMTPVCDRQIESIRSYPRRKWAMRIGEFYKFRLACPEKNSGKIQIAGLL